MWEAYFSPGVLAYAGGAFYVVGLVIINQVVLRLLVLIGTAVYVVYYATVATTPLMDAIYVSLLIGAGNLIGLFSLLARRSRLMIPRGYADVFDVMPPLPPGDFRALMRLGQRRRLRHDEVLTREGDPGQKLCFVISGKTHLHKDGASFTAPPLSFVGEIAFLTGQPYSATAWVPAGAEILEWDGQGLARLCARSPRFRLALEAAISVDLARKVSRGFGPDATHMTTPPRLRRTG